MNNLKRAAAITLMAGGIAATCAGVASADASGVAQKSPGVISGNVVQVPVDVEANVSGNTVSVIGLYNPAFGNEAVIR